MLCFVFFFFFLLVCVFVSLLDGEEKTPAQKHKVDLQRAQERQAEELRKQRLELLNEKDEELVDCLVSSANPSVVWFF